MMKIKLNDYDTVIRAFDMTIQHAIDSRAPILFDCVEIPTVITKQHWHGCPSYCPLYHDGVSDACVTECSADEWLAKKEEFMKTVTIKEVQ